MANDYLIVSKKILPAYLPKVIYARSLLNGHEVENITEAVKKAGISRSTYYKYKDFVFLPEEQESGRKAVLSLVLKHEPGVLSRVLNTLSDQKTSILTISQSIPVAGKANVSISLEIQNLKGSMDELLQKLKHLAGVKSCILNVME